MLLCWQHTGTYFNSWRKTETETETGLNPEDPMSDAEKDPDPMWQKKYWVGSATLKVGNNGICFELFNEGFIGP